MEATFAEKNLTKIGPLLSKYLSSKETDKVLEIIQEKENKKIIKDESSEIVNITCEYLTKDTYIKSRSLFDCCEKILEEVAKTAVPEETLLEFLEQADTPNDDEKFSALLKPMQIVLLQLSKRKEQSLGWCLSTIRNYIKALPVPENQNLEGDEKLLMDADPCVQRITNLYLHLSVFYKPFIVNIDLRGCCDSENGEVTEKQRLLLISFFLHLLEKPLVHLDLEWNPEYVKSSSRVVAEEIVHSLGCIMPDMLILLDYSGPSDTSSDEENIEVAFSFQSNLHSFISEDKVPVASVSVLYYLIFAEELQHQLIPAVYHPIYVLRSCLQHASELLKNTEILIIRKGLLISQAMMKFPVKQIPFLELEHSTYCNFVDVLANAMVYCSVEECRKLAATIFKSFLFKFDVKGRYLLMCNLQKRINHSGTLGYIITMLKDMIHQEMAQNNLPTFFKGKPLYDLIKGYCRLSNGAESDLVELADEILSSLNLLRFLLLHDSTNQTCIWDHIRSFETYYFNPLRNGVILSRAHYKLKLHELNEEIKLNAPGKRSEVTITVGGQQLPDVPNEQKVFLINSALNAFDLMECLLSHINECIELKMGH